MLHAQAVSLKNQAFAAAKSTRWSAPMPSATPPDPAGPAASYEAFGCSG
jgi:hypothetical protein